MGESNAVYYIYLKYNYSPLKILFYYKDEEFYKEDDFVKQMLEDFKKTYWGTDYEVINIEKDEKLTEELYDLLIFNKTKMKNKPQLSAEMEKRFNEEFTQYNKQGKAFIGYTISEEDLIKRIKQFIATALEEQRKQIAQKIKAKKSPHFKDFMREIEWTEKKRGTDSQLFNTGYESALDDVLVILNGK